MHRVRCSLAPDLFYLENFPDEGAQALSASSQHELEGGMVQTGYVEKLHGTHFQQASL